MTPSVPDKPPTGPQDPRGPRGPSLGAIVRLQHLGEMPQTWMECEGSNPGTSQAALFNGKSTELPVRRPELKSCHLLATDFGQVS